MRVAQSACVYVCVRWRGTTNCTTPTMGVQEGWNIHALQILSNYIYLIYCYRLSQLGGGLFLSTGKSQWSPCEEKKICLSLFRLFLQNMLLLLVGWRCWRANELTFKGGCDPEWKNQSNGQSHTANYISSEKLCPYVLEAPVGFFLENQKIFFRPTSAGKRYRKVKSRGMMLKFRDVRMRCRLCWIQSKTTATWLLGRRLQTQSRMSESSTFSRACVYSNLGMSSRPFGEIPTDARV